MQVDLPLQLNREIKQCLDDCQNCHAICLATSQYCLTTGGRHAEATHIRTLLDCAAICEISMDFMLRQSQFQNQMCTLCADICRQCADSCDSFGNDQAMKNCANMCRQCAQSCDAMAGGGGRLRAGGM
jgi:hypothetical protein